ncbi:MAG: DUF2971 domain-containing protein [Bacteroidales bacterium]
MLDKEFLDDIEYIIKNVPTLYKYLNCEGAKLMLLNSNLLFKNPFKFNDPYDCYPGLISFDKIPETFRQDLFSTFRNNYTPEIQQVLLENLNKVPDDKMSNMYRGYLIQHELSSLGISCFSEKCDKLLMWSHYANYHEGVCIGLDTKLLNNYLADKTPALIKVKYTEENFVKRDYFIDSKSALINCFRTKYEEWIYEEEIRIVLFKLFFDEDNRCLLPIMKEIVTKIYLGKKIDEKNAQDIISLRNSYYPKANVYRMELDDCKFKLIPKEVG